MTGEGPIYRVNEKGQRVYLNHRRQPYTPVPPELRKIGINKPDDPRAVRFHGRWFLPLPVLEDEARSMPETISDDASKGHRLKCRCYACRRPGGRYDQRMAKYEGHRTWRDADEVRSSSSSAPAP